MRLRILNILMIISIFSISVVSCKKDDFVPDSEKVGYLKINTAFDLNMEQMLKSGSDSEINQKLAMKIKNSTGVDIKTIEDISSIDPATGVALPVGEYYVNVYSASNSEAAFDTPYYEGTSEKFTIGYQRSTSVNVTLYIYNVKVTVELSDRMKKEFTYVKFVANNGTPLEYIYDSASPNNNTIDKEGFFAIRHDGLNYHIEVKNVDGQSYSTKVKNIDALSPRQHYNFKFDVDEDSIDGAMDITLVLDDSVNEENLSMDLDFAKPDPPRIKVLFGGVETTMAEEIDLYCDDVNTRVMEVVIPKGLQSVILQYYDESASINRRYELVEISSINKELLTKSGVVMDGIAKKATNISLDFTDLVNNYSVGKYPFEIIVSDIKGGYSQVKTIFDILSNVDGEALVATGIRAKYATLNARWFLEDRPDGLRFQIRKQGDSTWTDADIKNGVSWNNEDKQFSLVVSSLEPNTTYEYRALSQGDIDNGREDKIVIKSFKTDSTPTIENMNFDGWNSSNGYDSPNANGASVTWDTANGGTDMAGIHPTTQETSFVVSGSAVKMETKWVSIMGITKLAGGNIYTGKFGKVNISSMGADLYWGVPFNGKPEGLKGWYSYAPKTIDKTQSPYDHMKGKTDLCQIQIILCDWTAQFHVDSNGSYLDVQNDASVIGHGELVTDESTNGAYKEFYIPIVYRDNRTPTYVVISASASRYADYFTGGVGSILHIDEFEFIYDYGFTLNN